MYIRTCNDIVIVHTKLELFFVLLSAKLVLLMFSIFGSSSRLVLPLFIINSCSGFS
jgi:hypothetical protein